MSNSPVKKAFDIVLQQKAAEGLGEQDIGDHRKHYAQRNREDDFRHRKITLVRIGRLPLLCRTLWALVVCSSHGFGSGGKTG